MSRITIRRWRERQGCLSLIIVALAIVALALAAAIFITERLQTEGTAPTATVARDSIADVEPTPEATGALILKADSFNADEDKLNATPTPTPEPSPTPLPTFNPEQPYALVRPYPTAEGYLPIYKKANTEDKVIAITVDECASVTVTRKLVKLAAESGAKLTLFPSGENVLKAGMADVLKTAVYRTGFEIENRGYSAIPRLYQLSDANMAAEIWKQNIAVSYALGANYHMHFLRLYGGDGENDLRTHTYLTQEGYLGIANWTVNGAKVEAETIGNSLAPGSIYCFKANETDYKKISVLIDVAREQGYRMLTLNALFGYEENSYEPMSTDEILNQTLPELEETELPYYMVKMGDHTWAAYRVQARLAELGYLPGNSADGIYGSASANALSSFQARCGLAASGAADELTQERLFAEDAPRMQLLIPKDTASADDLIEEDLWEVEP